MASTGTIDPQSIQVLIAKAKTLINERLKAILRAESLPVSGAKATMQGRIIDRTLLNTFLHRALLESLVFVSPSMQLAQHRRLGVHIWLFVANVIWCNHRY